MKRNPSLLKQSYWFFIFFFLFTSLQAQNDGPAPNKMRIELGLNMTKLISAIFNTNGEELIDPYTFVTQYSKAKFGVRLGFFYVNKNAEDFNSGGFRLVKTTNVGGRIGLEFRKPIWKNLSVYYGADLILQQNKEKSSFSFSSESLISSDDARTIGGGPFLGLSLSIGQFMRLACESHFYYQHTVNNELLNDGFMNPISRKTKSSSLAHTLPTSLFVYIRF
ncbi:MAG: hypothetical protein IPH93_06885 [Saprospiraceae bacterium]|nr:hypothetical protein [Saprospiraceae bacterium]MBK9631099.1 hypothetical protein [Saprospiraceae bacterium]